MRTIRVANLSLCLLDEWAAKANMEHPLVKRYFDPNQPYSPSTNWGEGGPIIEREDIGLDIATYYYNPERLHKAFVVRKDGIGIISHTGTSKLIAAMRCYVEKTFGPEVPE